MHDGILWAKGSKIKWTKQRKWLQRKPHQLYWRRCLGPGRLLPRPLRKFLAHWIICWRVRRPLTQRGGTQINLPLPFLLGGLPLLGLGFGAGVVGGGLPLSDGADSLLQQQSFFSLLRS